MTLEWSCFISYRLGKGKLATDIIETVYNALLDELELLVDEGVYLSQGKLKPGDKIDELLKSNLCHSACMVIIFTGKYFSEKHPYCAREYLAMKQLEDMRLEKLGVTLSKGHSLIIPVVLRDLDQLPPELQKRMWCDFQEFQQDEGKIRMPRAFFEYIRQISKYIADRHRELSISLTPKGATVKSFIFLMRKRLGSL